jgi:hypothetical protein
MTTLHTVRQFSLNSQILSINSVLYGEASKVENQLEKFDNFVQLNVLLSKLQQKLGIRI